MNSTAATLPPPLQRQAGEQIGDYRLERPLGAGGAGEVWLAENLFTRQQVAMKLCHDPAMQETLRHEARTLGELMAASRTLGGDFPSSVARLLETRLSEHPTALVVEYCAGGDVRSLLRDHEPLPLPLVKHVLAATLDGLHWAHGRGILHRDIKPENILLATPYQPGAPYPAVKVSDFGLGLPASERLLSIHRSLLSGALSVADGSSSGTLEYMSPEQIEGRELSVASDIYAAGVVFFELITGRRPRGRIVPSALRSELPAAWDELFERCYAYDPGQRFSSAEAMGRALDVLPLEGGARSSASAWRSTPPLADLDPHDGSPGRAVALDRLRRTEASLLRAAKSGGYELEATDGTPLATAKLVSYEGASAPAGRSDAGPIGPIAKRLQTILWVLLGLSFIGSASIWFTSIGIPATVVAVMLSRRFIFLGLVIAYSAEMIFRDWFQTGDRDAGQRLVVEAATGDKERLGFAAPHATRPQYVELHGADDEVIGYLRRNQGGSHDILGAEGQSLYLVRDSYRARRVAGRKLRQPRLVYHGGAAEPVAISGSDTESRPAGETMLWFDPASQVTQRDRGLLVLALLALKGLARK